MTAKPLELGALRNRIPPGMQQATGVLIAIGIAHGLSYLFHAIMSRLLGPAEYGVVVSLMAVFVILAVPINLIQTVVANYTAQLRSAGTKAKLKALSLDSFKVVLIGGGLITVLFMLASGIVADFLHVPSTIPVLVTGALLLPALLLPVAQGILLGLERFMAFSSLYLVVSTGRLLFGLVLVFLGLGAVGALGAHAISETITLLVSIALLGTVLRQKGEPHGIPGARVYGYSVRALLGFLCFAVLTNIDVPIVKHFFPPEEAGYYAAASMLGKVVLLASGAVAFVMFPKSVYSYAQNGDTASLARKAVGATALISGGVALVPFLLPSLAVRVFFGGQYAAVVPLAGPFALAMTLYAIANVVLFYYLSVENTTFVAIMLAAALLEVGLLWFFHSNLVQVVMVLAGVAALLLIVSEAVCRGLTGRKRAVIAPNVSGIPPLG